MFGTILNNQFAAAMKHNLPAALQKYNGSAALDNPQVLLSPAAGAHIRALFAKFGAQGADLYQAFMHAVRLSLSTAISDLFLLSAIVGLIGLVVVLFLREDALRRTHLTVEQEELLMAEGEAVATGGFTPEGSAAEGGQEPVISRGSGDDREPQAEPAG